jgi:AraC family transcriptional regulator
LGVHGDIDIIPPWTSSVWEPEDVDTALVLGITPSLFRRVAQDLGIDAARVEIRNRFQIRDRQIENIGWALKADMEAGYPGGRIFRESLGTALTAYLLERHSSREGAPLVGHGRSEGRRVKDMLAYIEDHLDRDLSLAELAAVARISPSHCKHIFRQVMGSPLHRYVIERRVERARVLLGNGDLPVSEVALRTGFAHQSHLARHMKRLLGCTPGELARYSRSLLSETALS